MIDGNGYKITFDSNLTKDGTYDGYGEYGIRFGSGLTYFRVYDLEIHQGKGDSNGVAASGLYGGDSATCLLFPTSNTKYITVDSCSWYSYGHDAQGAMSTENTTGADMIAFYACHIESHVLSFRDRQYPVSGIKFSRSHFSFPSAGDFNISVRACTVAVSHHTGILVGGVAKQRENWVKVDVFNELWNLDSSTSGNISWDNGHMYGELGGAGPTWEMVKCFGMVGTDYYGGRGMHFAYASLADSAYWDTSFAIIDSCTFIVWEGNTGYWDGDYEAGHAQARGIRFRYTIPPTLLRWNKLYQIGGGSGLPRYMGDQVHNIWFTSDREETQMLAIRNQWVGNDFKAIWVGDLPEVYEGGQFCNVILERVDSSGYNTFADSCGSSYNRYETQGISILFRAAVNKWQSYRDSFFTTEVDSAWLDSVTGGLLQFPIVNTRMDYGWAGSTQRTVFGIGSQASSNIDSLIVIDPYFGTGLSWDSISSTTATGDQEIFYQRTVQFTVTDSGQSPVSGASVVVVNEDRDDTATVGTTNGSGIIYDTLTARYLHWTNQTKDGDTSFAYKFLAISGTDTVTLSDTLDVATAMGADYPVALTDLGAASEEEEPAATQRRMKGARLRGGKIR
jgi:hypothetical protein